MKIYIKASFTPTINIDYSIFDGTPFKCDTETSYYNDFLDEKELKYMQDAKNRTGKIVMMSPEEYFSECANKVFSGRLGANALKEQRRYDEELNDEYAEAMRNGSKFPLCYINYADHNQEGLHRMMTAGDVYGWDKEFPVLVITVYDEDLEKQKELIREFNDFNFHTFKDIVRRAADNISDWKAAPPDNFVTLLHDEIIELAKDAEYDIDVDIDMDEVDGEPRACVYLSRYFDYEPEMLSGQVDIWLENLYNLKDEEPKVEPDVIDDIDISDLFFK